MRSMKLLGLSLLAALALAAVATATASASEPSIWQCVKASKNAEKKYTGGYTDKKCSAESPTHEGKYQFEEWFLGNKEAKTGKQGKVKELKAKGAKGIGANLEVIGLGGVFCAKTAATGFFNGPKSARDVVATFSGCELEHKPCKSLQAGTKSGEVKTFPLKAEIGYLSAAEHLAGAAFSPESGLYLAQFECGGEQELRVSGSVIGEVKTGESSPYNKFSKSVTIAFEESAGKQECRGGKECLSLEGVAGEHKLEVELSQAGQEVFGPRTQAGEEDTIEGKGEELLLKA